jgi:hypothetical protein
MALKHGSTLVPSLSLRNYGSQSSRPISLIYYQGLNRAYEGIQPAHSKQHETEYLSCEKLKLWDHSFHPVQLGNSAATYSVTTETFAFIAYLRQYLPDQDPSCQEIKIAHSNISFTSDENDQVIRHKKSKASL